MRQRVPRTIVGLGLLFILLGCGEERGPRVEPIRIGLVTSLEGALADVGGPLLQAARVAEREVQAAGGLLDGRPVEFVVVDDRTQPEIAAGLAEGLIAQDGVVALLGALSSDSSLMAAQFTLAAQVPQVSCCSTSPALTTAQPSGDRYLFRTVPSDLLQGVAIARHAMSIGCRSLAVMYSFNSYGTGLQEVIKDDYQARGGTIAGDLAYTPGLPSYADDVRVLAAQELDCVALVGLPADGGAILRDWSGLSERPDVRWIGTDGLKTRGFVDAAGDSALVDGFVGTAPITAPATMQFNDFAAAYEAIWGEPTGIFAGNQYDAAALLMLAIEMAGTTQGTAIRDALLRVARADGQEEFFGPGNLGQALTRIRAGEDIDYFGASGAVDFDSFGDVVTDYEIWRYDGGLGVFVSTSIVRASELQ